MYNFILESKRGGLTVANQRLATSTKGKKYFKEEFEKFFPSGVSSTQDTAQGEGGCGIASTEILEEFILYLE